MINENLIGKLVYFDYPKDLKPQGFLGKTYPRGLEIGVLGFPIEPQDMGFFVGYPLPSEDDEPSERTFTLGQDGESGILFEEEIGERIAMPIVGLESIVGTIGALRGLSFVNCIKASAERLEHNNP
jgi:hypothetical protein